MVKRVYTAKGAEALFGSALAYTFTAILIREVAPMWGDKAQVAARWFLTFVVIAAYFLIKKKSYKLPKNTLGYLILLSLFFTILVVLFTVSVQKTTVANSLFMFFAACLASTFLFGTIFLRESVTISKVLSLLLVFSGLCFYGGAIVGGSTGLILGALAGLFGGGSNILFKLLKNVENSLIMLYQFGFGSIFAIGLTLISGDEIIRQISLKASLLTLFFVVCLLVASGLTIYGFKHFDLNIGAAILASELVFGTLLGFIFYSEIPAANEMIGGMLIFVGAVIGSLEFDRRIQKNPALPKISG